MELGRYSSLVLETKLDSVMSLVALEGGVGYNSGSLPRGRKHTDGEFVMGYLVGCVFDAAVTRGKQGGVAFNGGVVAVRCCTSSIVSNISRLSLGAVMHPLAYQTSDINLCRHR
jgi:hypothetical protein